MSGRHAALDVVGRPVRKRAHHPVLITIGAIWVLVAVGGANSVTSADHGGVGEWLEIFGATFGTPLFFIALVGIPLGLYAWLMKKITDRFPGATALVLSWGAGRAAATGHPWRAALYGTGAYQSAQNAADQRGEQWVGGAMPQGGGAHLTPEALAAGLGLVSGVGADLKAHGRQT